MNFKKNWKRFWTLSRASEGFTLVELIVVIAIMAILAGVAVPAYTGYIKKAEKAGDLQLLGAVNTAFAAAVMENGSTNAMLSGASATLSEGKITKVAASATGVDLTGVDASFRKYFAGNEDSAFKVITALGFDPENYVFVDAASHEGELVFGYGAYFVKVSSEDVKKLSDSTFGTVIGSEVLLGKVDTLSEIAAGLLDLEDSVISKVIYGPEGDSDVYITELANRLGMSPTELEAKMGEDGNKFLANSLVLTAASKTTGMDTSFLGTAGFADRLKSDLNDPSKATDALAQAAMAYGMYTAYANSSYGTTEMKNKINNLETSGGFSGLTDMLGDLESDKFSEYLSSAEGKADMEAYKSAMNVINTSTAGNTDIAIDVMTNDFNNDELANLIGGLMK